MKIEKRALGSVALPSLSSHVVWLEPIILLFPYYYSIPSFLSNLTIFLVQFAYNSQAVSVLFILS